MTTTPPEQTLKLEIRQLMPDIAGMDDPCLLRLENELKQYRGISRAHIEKSDQARLCMHYNPLQVDAAELDRAARKTAGSLAARYHHAQVLIEGMDCSDCARVIEHSLERVRGVTAVKVDYASAQMQLEFDATQTTRRGLEKRVISLGYSIPRRGLSSRLAEHRELVISFLAGLLLLAGWLVDITGKGLGFRPELALYAGSYLLGGWHVARHAIHALRERHLDTDALMLVAALGAAALGHFAEGALLLFLFSLGHALEEYALNRARSAIHALGKLVPRSAIVRRDGKDEELPVEQIRLGDAVIIPPGARLPVDGSILSGTSSIDQSPVTGESLPVDKAPGDRVFAGTINGQGSLEVSADRLAADTTLARVIRLVEEAQAEKSPTQQTIEKVERVFVPAVLIAMALLIAIPPLLGVPFETAFLRAMTLLVAASPCALAVGAPAAVLAGTAQAARQGILIKGGAHLENLARLRAVAFDKTGTLTRGKPAVTGLLALEGQAEDRLLGLAAALESRSNHPLAAAIVAAAGERGLQLPEVSGVQSLAGGGLSAELDGETVLVARYSLLRQMGVPFPAAADEQVTAWEQQGMTVSAVAHGGQPIGLIALADALRPEAAEATARLRRLGIERLVMLTGDNHLAGEAIGKQAGVDEVRAQLLPEQKLDAIRALNRLYGTVAMIGDGVNDAPALANATVGIAIASAGADVALETADVALMGADLTRLPFAVALGRATRAIIRQNLVIAFGVIAVLAIAAVTGAAGIGWAVLFHEGSTLLVVANALRLLGFKQPN